jgi:hypothetical protein
VATPTIPTTADFPTRWPFEADLARRAHHELVEVVAALADAEAALVCVGESYAAELNDPDAPWEYRRDWFHDKAIAASTLAERASDAACLAMTLHLLETGQYR